MAEFQEGEPRPRKKIVLPTKIILPPSARLERMGADPFLVDIGRGQAKAAEESREIGDMTRRFWNMLVSTVARSGYEPPQGRRTEVLDLACGVAEEAVVLNSFFGGGEFRSENDNVRVTGIDTNEGKLAQAREAFHTPSHRYQFIRGDATNLDEYPQIPQQADVVVIRHQQLSDSKNKAVWEEILRQGLNRMTPEGRMIITSYSEEEHQMILDALAREQCEVVLNERNRWAKPLSRKGASEDRNVAIVKKTAA